MVRIIKSHLIFFYFLFALFFAWIIWIPMALHTIGIINFPLPIFIGQSVGALSILASLFVLEKLTEKKVTLKSIFDKIRIKNTNRTWLIVAIFLLPLFTILGNLLDYILTLEPNFQLFQPEVFDTLNIAIFFLIPLTLVAGLLSSPILEEPGWRGFAIERLQTQHGRFLGSLILGSLWWLWHQPINIANELPITIYSYLGMVLMSFAIDTIYNLSGQNLLSAMIMHSSAIVRINYFYSNSESIGVIVVSIVIIATLRFIERNRKKYENNSP